MTNGKRKKEKGKLKACSMVYKTFEETTVWQDTRKFVRSIYEITRTQFQRDYSLIDQLRRAAISILLNISEGFERKGRGEAANFLSIAKGSAGEVRAVLYIALDNHYISQQEFDRLLGEIQSISRQLSAFGRYLIEEIKKEKGKGKIVNVG